MAEEPRQDRNVEQQARDVLRQTRDALRQGRNAQQQQDRDAQIAQQAHQALRFDNYMRMLFTALNIQDANQIRLRELFRNFRPNEHIRIIAQTEEFVNALVEADTALQAFFVRYGTMYNISREAWNGMTSSLAELQMLSLLEKVEGTCDEVINALLDVLSTKITQVNTILKSKLNRPAAQGDGGVARGGGGNINDKYLNKYLKYKNKYVYLKRNY